MTASRHVDVRRLPLGDLVYASQCRATLEAEGALVLDGFFRSDAVAEVVSQCGPSQAHAFYADGTHNVYLTDPDPSHPPAHPSNRQVVSSKGLIADDEIPPDSPLREVYEDREFRSFLCAVLGVSAVHPYDDPLSSINVHFAPEGTEGPTTRILVVFAFNDEPGVRLSPSALRTFYGKTA